MSETLIPVEESGKTSCIQPFALQFLEAIPATELKEVSGRYNDKLQVWEFGDGELSTAFPVASFPKVERPPTISTVPTRITPKVVSADAGPDD